MRAAHLAVVLQLQATGVVREELAPQRTRGLVDARLVDERVDDPVEGGAAQRVAGAVLACVWVRARTCMHMST